MRDDVLLHEKADQAQALLAETGLNYSTDDVTADGLTHGHWLLLRQLLDGTPYLDRLTSAAPLLARLRGRKSPAEVELIRQAVAATERVVGLLTPEIRPGRSERDLAAVAVLGAVVRVVGRAVRGGGGHDRQLRRRGPDVVGPAAADGRHHDEQADRPPGRG